jgi:hypothetical protein
MIVNYTEPGYILNEGYVVRYGERAADGTIVLHSYGEGNGMVQAEGVPIYTPAWKQANDLVWDTNARQIAAAVRARLRN